MNPQLTINYSKVQFATFYYKTRVFGYVRRTKPRQRTVHGLVVPDSVADYAEKTGRLDDWIPQLRLCLSVNRTLKFVGEEAKKRWKEYNTRIYKQHE